MNVERHAPLAAALLIALPTLLSYYPPMSDLPMHEGVVGAMRHLGDKTYFPEEIYFLNLGHPNQLFHVSAYALSWVVGTRWAVKLVVALSQVAIFHSGARFADYLGRARWGALLLAPLALGFTYYWGLVANLIGFAAFLYALPLLDSVVEVPTWRKIAKSCGIMLFLFFAHESTLAIAVCIVCLFTIAHPLDKRLTLMRLVPALAGIVIVLGSTAYQLTFVPKTFSSMTIPSVWFSFLDKFKYLPNAIVGSYDWLVQVLLFFVGLLGVIALAAVRRHDEAPAGDPKMRYFARARALLHRFRFEVFAAICFLLYLTMPFNFHGITLLHERFVGPAWAILVVVASPKGTPSRLGKIVTAALPLGIVLTAWPQFIEANTSYQQLEVLLAKVPLGSTVAECVVDQRDPFARVFSVGPGVARSLALRGGRASLALTGSPISPIRMKQEYVWTSFDVRMYVYGSRTFMPTFDFERWGYVLTQSRVPRLRAQLKEAFASEAELIGEEGEWMLFRGRRPTLGMAAPDAIPPQSAVNDTVLHRVLTIDSRMRELEDAATEQPGK